MKLARRYNALLKRHLLHYAAWSPVTDRYEVGDYGLFRGGVFQSLGNVREFGVDPQPRPGAASARFSYTSSGAVMVRTQGGVQTDAFAESPVEAELSIDFQGESSFFIRTTELSVMEMPSVDAVAYQLRGRKDARGREWKLGWRVVRKVYIAENPAILASSERETKVRLAGRADALRKLEAGRASAEIAVTSSRADMLEIVGKSGPVALDLFRVRVTGRAALVSFSADDDGEPAQDVVEPELDEDWIDDPRDDSEELLE